MDTMPATGNNTVIVGCFVPTIKTLTNLRMKTQSEWQRENAQQARQSLERYLFYYNRYSIHKQSLQFESKLYDKIKVTPMIKPIIALLSMMIV